MEWHKLGTGVIIGMILFFVLAYFGYIDKFLHWIEHRKD